MVFFIFLVANIGGALIAARRSAAVRRLPARRRFLLDGAHLWLQTAIVAGLRARGLRRARRLVLPQGPAGDDRRRSRAAGRPRRPRRHQFPADRRHHRARSSLSAAWKPGIIFDVYGTTLELQNIAARRRAAADRARCRSCSRPNEHREANGFTWEPIREVAILFAGIFVCIIPVLAMLEAGRDGAFAWLLAAVTDAGRQPRTRSPISG